MNKAKAIFLFLCIFTLPRQLPARNDITRKVVPSRSIQKNVDLQVMERIYQEIKTPYKYGIILKGDNNSKLDCPSVFRFGNSWYMMYIIFDGNGYETAIAQSTDLITWKPIGNILRFQPGRWDGMQAAGYVALQDFDWGGSYKLQKYNDKYWLSYIGGALKGYETDPLAIGIAWTNNPTKPIEWNRLNEPVLSRDQPDVRDFEKLTQYKSHIICDKNKTLGYPFVMFYNGKPNKSYERIGMAVSKDMTHWLRYGKEPVLSRDQPDVRDFEKLTQYKSHIIYDKNKTLGYPFVMFYNGKPNKGYERIGMAVSKDMTHWLRYGKAPVIDNGKGISGDPQITCIENIWVMFYFGAFWRPKAFDTFACSYDLVHWTKWIGPDLVAPSEPWDKQYAHKPWVIKHEGIVYHFYCAVGGQGRVIALATSKDIRYLKR